MIYAYVRVSTNVQILENQQHQILMFANDKKIIIDEWVEETISGVKSASQRSLGTLLEKLKKGDTVIITELSRLGRNIMDVMSTLNECINQNVTLYSIKEGFTLNNDINTKVLAFAFSLSAEIERQLISQRTKDALARKKYEGKKLGRPKGSRNKINKLSGKENEISNYLIKGIPVATIAKIYGINRLTMTKLTKTLQPKDKKNMTKTLIVKA